MSGIEQKHTMDEKNIGPTTDGSQGNDEGTKDDGQLEQTIDPKKEKILLAKLDLLFTPVIMLVYLSCFLDRTNIVRNASTGLTHVTSTKSFSGQCKSGWNARGYRCI